MRKKSTIFLLIIISLLYMNINIEASTRGKSIQPSIEKGVYIPDDIITVKKLRKLPIPSTNEDYAFLQSIGKISNIVIGKFKSDERVITLIKDKNADGKVDLVAHRFVDLKRIDIDPNPDKYCSAEKFAKMKKEIINGKSEVLSPNPEGLNYLRALLKTPANIMSVKFGFKVIGFDIDEKSKKRVSYYYSYDKVRGADLVFEIKYYNLGTRRMSPPINYSIYCKNSLDSYIIEMTKKLTKETQKFIYD